MMPVRRALMGVLPLLMLTVPVMVGCGSNAPPGGSPPTSPPATTTSPTPTTTPAPTPSATTPAAMPGWTAVSSRVAYQWHWPGSGPVTVTHTYRVPPVAELVAVGAGNHPSDPGDRPYNRMSFSFTTAYPSYSFQYVDRLVADGSGEPVPLAGSGVLRVVFNPAQAHTQDGTASSIRSQPPAHLGMSRMVAYAQAGDFEGYVSYGIGIAWPNPGSNPQIAVRVYEVTYVNGQGAHRYVVAFDIDAR